MTQPNEQYVYFTVTGDFDPTEISNIAGVKPTEYWLKGEVNPRTQMERKSSRWSLYSRLDRSCQIEDHITDVIEQLTTSKRGFIEISSRYGGVMQLVAYFHTGYPGLHLDSKVVESLAEYAVGVDFDFYYLYSDQREDS
jgi:hypothetical protein